MPTITKPYGDFVNNVDVADATKVNAQMNLLYNTINGGLDGQNAPSLGYNITGISATTTLTTSQVGIIECTAGANGITVTLPSATTAGLRYIIKKVDSGVGVVTINTTSSQMIDGVTSRTLVNQYAEIHVISNGTNWDVIIENVTDLPTFAMSRQALINGNFDVWQRGTSFTANVYTADRWSHVQDGSGGVFTISQQSFTVGQTSVPNEPKYFLRHQVTTAATGQTYNTLMQKIESVRTFAGRKITISFYAKADTARSLGSTIWQQFGSGGSTAVGTVGSSFSLTTSWQKFTATFNVPSISGKTIGANGDDCLQIELDFPINSLFTIDIAQVQVNAGDQALPFQPRSFTDEESNAQRYEHRIGGTTYTIFGVGDAVTTTQANIFIPLPRKMRIVPTVTTAGNFRINLGGLAVTGISVDTTQSRTDGIVLTVTVASGLTVGQSVLLQANNDTTAYINFDAEL